MSPKSEKRFSAKIMLQQKAIASKVVTAATLTTTSANRVRGAAIALVALLLAACSSTPDNRQVSLPVPQSAALTERLPATEREHARILASYSGAYVNAQLQAVIEQTVDRLVAASERPDLKYKVTILNSPAINAFALPNGQLYITRGLVALSNDKAELASVLAHEMGHVIARHAAIREEQAKQAAIISQVANDVLSDPQTGALALAKSKLTLASFSRAQEFEADGIGVGISARAGFDPFGASRFLTDMQRNADLKPAAGSADARGLDFLASHPATPDRVKNALANARQFSGPGAGERDRAEYLGDLDGVVYGEDPSEGFARGRRFLHLKRGNEAMRLDVVSVPAEQSLPDYLKSGWIEHVDSTSVEEFTVNGFTAATATAAGDEWSFRLFAVRFGSDVYRFIFAAKNKTPQVDRSFRESIETFRRMSLRESEQVHPLHLKIVTVGPNDTVESLARRMASADHALDRFRVLNGLAAHDRVKPGEKVKIVVD